MPATLEISQEASGQTPSAAEGCRDLGLVLTAIVISDSKNLAFFRSTEDADKPLRLQEGEDYRDWTLSAIEESSVILRRGGVALRLSLEHDHGCAPE